MSIIYTPLPIEMITEGMDKQELNYRELEVQGAKLLVEQVGADKCRVVRLISTNPADYLKNEFQPGTELTFTPKFNWEADPNESHNTLT